MKKGIGAACVLPVEYRSMDNSDKHKITNFDNLCKASTVCTTPTDEEYDNQDRPSQTFKYSYAATSYITTPHIQVHSEPSDSSNANSVDDLIPPRASQTGVLKDAESSEDSGWGGRAGQQLPHPCQFTYNAVLCNNDNFDKYTRKNVSRRLVDIFFSRVAKIRDDKKVAANPQGMIQLETSVAARPPNTETNCGIMSSTSSNSGSSSGDKANNIVSWIYLSLWFLLNTVITLYGKAMFSVYQFPYPILMTVAHMIFTFLGVAIMELTGLFVPKKIDWNILANLIWFSILFSANIWLSNASLMAVSVGMHQAVRTTVPLFTMATSLVVFAEMYPLRLLPSVVVVVAGVGFTMKGDVDFAVGPFCLVLFSCFLSSLKGIMTQKTQVGSMGLSALDLLRYLCPLAIVELLFIAFALGEVNRLINSEGIGLHLAFHLSALGCVAFALNYVSFRCSALMNPLTINVAGNVKQVATSLIGITMFGGILTLKLILGILSTSLGAFWYTAEMRKWKQIKLENKFEPSTASYAFIGSGSSNCSSNCTSGINRNV